MTIKKIKKIYRGETIVEVLIAMVVITIGATTATSLIITSMKANLYNKDSLLSLNLAQEGLEYMHNLRDTNWIKFSAKPDDCWNSQPGVGTCSSANLLDEAVTTNGYRLGESLDTTIVASTLNLANGITGPEINYRLNYYDLNSSVNSDGLGGFDDDYDFIGSTTSTGTLVAPSKFYRSIEIDYKSIADSAPWAITDSNDKDTANMMIMNTSVQWMDGSQFHEIKLSGALASYK